MPGSPTRSKTSNPLPLVALVALLSVANVAHAQDEAPVADASRNDFGELTIPGHLWVSTEPTPFETTILVTPPADLGPRGLVMFSFQVLAEPVQLVFDGLETADGQAVPLDRDERTHGTEPKVFVLVSDIPPTGQVFKMKATATSATNGQFRVAVLVMAFTKDFETVNTASGTQALLYNETMLHATGIQGGPLAAPFHGSGNVPSWGFLATVSLMGVAAAAVRSRRRAV